MSDEDDKIPRGILAGMASSTDCGSMRYVLGFNEPKHPDIISREQIIVFIPESDWLH